MVGLDVILGGVTGLIGNAFTTWFKYKNAKMDIEHKEKMVSLETQAMVQEAQMNIQITKSKIEGEIELADSAAFTTSQKVGSEKLFHEKWIDMIMAGGERKWTGWFFRLMGTIIAGAFALVDWFNAFMRPGLTMYLVGCSTYITYMTYTILDKAGIGLLTATQALGLYQQVTSTVIYLAVSSVTWWFGDRTMSKFLQGQGAKQNKNLMSSPTPKKPNGGAGGGGSVDF